MSHKEKKGKKETAKTKELKKRERYFMYSSLIIITLTIIAMLYYIRVKTVEDRPYINETKAIFYLQVNGNKTQLVGDSTKILLKMKNNIYPNVVNLTLFWIDGCPHCRNEIIALAKLRNNTKFNLNAYEVGNHKGNKTLFREYCAKFNQKPEGAPALFIGNNKPIIGFINTYGFMDKIKKEIISENNKINH
ncbi:MAG: hypothetical protein GWP09_01395 [Nitrospiraceae bacterium]|nr:hypothetical protein [Nitrospiraceae bacterium]